MSCSNYNSIFKSTTGVCEARFSNTWKLSDSLQLFTSSPSSWPPWPLWPFSSNSWVCPSAQLLSSGPLMTPSYQTSWHFLPHVLRFPPWPSVSPSPPSCPLRSPLSFSSPPLACSRKVASHLRHCSHHFQNYFLRYFHCCKMVNMINNSSSLPAGENSI